MTVLKRPSSLVARLGSVSAIAIVGLTVISCGGATTSNTHKDLLRIGTAQDIHSLDPADHAAQNRILTNQVYDALVNLDSHANPSPALATSWQWGPDDMSLTLHLRQGVTFQDGKPFTADDVVYNAKRYQDPKAGNGSLVSYNPWVKSVQATDTSTVLFTFTQPSPLYMAALAGMDIGDKATLEGPNASTKANGTGPYSVTEWAPGDHLTLTRNDHYWGKKPSVREIDIKLYGSTQALGVALKAGAVDFVQYLDYRTAADLKSNPKYRLLLQHSDAYYITFNVNNTPTSNPKVREAINYAINRDRFLKEVLYGIGTKMAWPWPEGSPAYDAEANSKYRYNLNTAKRLLQEAGVAPGTTVDLVTNDATPATQPLGEMLQSDLSSIGIRLVVHNLEFAQWRADSFKVGGWPNLLAGQNGNILGDPATLLLQARPYRPDANTAGYRDPRMISLANNVFTTTDEAARTKLLKQIGDIVQTSNFIIPIATNEDIFAMRAGVTGITTNPDGGVFLGGVAVS